MYRQLTRNPRIVLKPGHITASGGMANGANFSPPNPAVRRRGFHQAHAKDLDLYLTGDELNM